MGVSLYPKRGCPISAFLQFETYDPESNRRYFQGVGRGTLCLLVDFQFKLYCYLVLYLPSSLFLNISFTRSKQRHMSLFFGQCPFYIQQETKFLNLKFERSTEEPG